MTAPAPSRPIRVFCIDDNRLLARAMQRRIACEPDLAWVGWSDEHGRCEPAGVAGPAGAADNGDIAACVRRALPDVVMLDIDLPGQSAFELVRRIGREAPGARVLMFSGHVRADYLDRALDAGAWGYVSKNESMLHILAAVRRAAAGEFTLTPDVHRECMLPH